MKKLLILILMLFSFKSFSQRDKVLIKNDVYQIIYSEVLQQPINVKYTVLCSDGTFSRKGMNFKKPEDIITSDNDDYKDNDYDKGHLAPAADFNCDNNKLLETFSYLNCALQNTYLNKGTWEFLENHERELSKKYKVNVEVRLGFSKKSIKLKSGATVPDYFIKIIKYNKITEKYYFKNEKPLYTDYTKYKI